MMQDISTTLRGRIGSDPSMRKIRGDTCVTTFRLAIPRWRFATDARTGNASYVEDGAYWYTIETWETLAQNVFECCHKGEPVIVVARPVPNAWVDGNGAIRSSIVFRASAVGHDIARGRTTFSKNGSHSVDAPAAGSEDDPFSTRQGQSTLDPRAQEAPGCVAPSEEAEDHGQGEPGGGGAQSPREDGRAPLADAHSAAPTQAPPHGTLPGPSQSYGSEEGSPTAAPTQRCAPTHDGPEEHSSDPCVQVAGRFDYSQVHPSEQSPGAARSGTPDDDPPDADSPAAN